MENLKGLVLDRFKVLFLLSASMALSLVLLMIRMKLNQSFFLLFLVWNLFLAIIPYAVTTWMISKPKPHKFHVFIGFCIWLPFLPNAPYIVTDLLHLQNSSNHLLWLDVLVITSFAFNGLVMFFLSMRDMEQLLKGYVKSNIVSLLLFVIFGMTAFGIYLGRFLRYNSWEILNNPIALFRDMLHIIFQPNIDAWIFTLTFGAFLWISYKLLTAFSSEINTQQY